MATKAGIFNQALYKLKRARVTSPSQSVELTDVYASVRDAVLRAHPWNCALKRTQLTKDSSTTDWKYSNAYTLPADPYALRVVRLEDLETKFEVVTGRKLVTDAESPLKLTIVIRVTDEAVFDADFEAALAVRLAFEVGPKLGASTNRLKELWAEYKAKIGEARSIDGQEGHHLELEAEDYLDARL